MADSARAFQHESLIMAVRRLSEEGGLIPQLRYVKQGKLCVVEMPQRLRLNPTTVIKALVEREKPEVVNLTAMAWLGEPDSPSSGRLDESPQFAAKEKEVLVSITFSDSATKYFSVFELLRRGDEIELRDGLGSDIAEADITIGAGGSEKEILQGPIADKAHRSAARISSNIGRRWRMSRAFPKPAVKQPDSYTKV